MHPLRRLSAAEQTAAHLREGLRRGRWCGTLPGVARLAADLDVSPPTVRAALRRLEVEGLLGGRGWGRSRAVTGRGAARRPLRVGILLFEAVVTEAPPIWQLLLQIQHALEAAGHEVFFSAKSQVELRQAMPRIAHLVLTNPADAWIVMAGSHPLLEWFVRQKTPCLALYGHTTGLEIARTGPDKVPPFIAATRQLLALGHRRVVLIARRTRREPTLGSVESAFLNELVAHGIVTGSHRYYLPDWEETPQGFCALLERLFRVTPPTGLIIEETPRVIAAMQFFLQHGIAVPKQVSLVSADYDNSLEWCHPAVAHMRWDDAPIVQRIVRWVAAVKRGRADRETINFPAQFVPGGSIGPAPATGH